MQLARGYFFSKTITSRRNTHPTRTISREFRNRYMKIVDSMPDDEEINLSRHIKGHVDKHGWITVDEAASEKAVISALSKVGPFFCFVG